MEAFTNEIQLQKLIAIENRDRPNRMVLVGILTGFFLAVVSIVAFATPVEWTLIVAGLVSLCVGVLLGVVRQRHPAKCPKCGLTWDISTDAEPNILTWKQCPGCGLETNAGLLSQSGVEIVHCARCYKETPKDETRKMWRPPLFVLTVVHMKPADEGSHFYCRRCIGTLNLSICLLALMGGVVMFTNPALLYHSLLAGFAVGLMVWFVLQVRWKIYAKIHERCLKRLTKSENQRAGDS